MIKEMCQKWLLLSFCHVEHSETSRIRRVGILHYIQNDKESNNLIGCFDF